MICETAPALSVIIPTRNRAGQLERVLHDLEPARAAAPVPTEIIVADNGSTDGTAALLQQWCGAGPQRVRLCVAQPGRSRALNRTLTIARGALLVFTDDDVEVPANWLAAISAFFNDHPEYEAAMGRVLLPPCVTDPEVVALADRYWGTLPLFDRGTAVRDLDDMYGCNMVVRRPVFEAVGTFDERLGVGASGLGEDIELAGRIRRAGMRIGYMPDAVIYHTVDPARLTLEAFRDFNLRWARSRWVTDPPPWRKSLARFLDAAIWCGWTLVGNRRRGLQAWARMVRHRELVRLRYRAG